MAGKPKSLAETIFLARKGLGLTQGALGKLVGRTAVTVCKWESGEFGPADDIVPLVAKILGLREKDLIKRSLDYKPRTPRTGPRLLLRSTAPYLTYANIILSLDQVQEHLKVIRGHLKTLEDNVASPAPSKPRSKKPKHS
jgi:transcriptional regulator with XRE-family HTH domain